VLWILRSLVPFRHPGRKALLCRDCSAALRPGSDHLIKDQSGLISHNLLQPKAFLGLGSSDQADALTRRLSSIAAGTPDFQRTIGQRHRVPG